jgi:hypothetical protein
MVHGYLNSWTCTNAIATGVMLAHSNCTKRHRVLVNEACPSGFPDPPRATLHPLQLDYLDHAGFAFHNDNEAVQTPTMLSTTTSQCSLVLKLMNILEDMWAPDYKLAVTMIEWAQAAVANGSNCCPTPKPLPAFW